MSDERTSESGGASAPADERRAETSAADPAAPPSATEAAEQPDADGVGEQPDAGGAAEAARDAADPEFAEPVEPDESGRELDALQAELDSLNERHLRLAAEFDNYRKRIRREREGLRTRSQADFAERLLEALDDLQRVADYEAEATSVEALLEGVRLVEKKLRRAMTALGLEAIDAEGEFFNPATMEAMMTVPAEHPEEDDVVADVFQRGYRFHDILIRPARVRVKKYEQD